MAIMVPSGPIRPSGPIHKQMIAFGSVFWDPMEPTQAPMGQSVIKCLLTGVTPVPHGAQSASKEPFSQ